MVNFDFKAREALEAGATFVAVAGAFFGFKLFAPSESEQLFFPIENETVSTQSIANDYDCFDILFQVGDKKGKIKREFITTVDGTRVYNIHGDWVINDKDNPFCI